MKFKIKVKNHEIYTIYRKSFMFWKPQVQNSQYVLEDGKYPTRFISIAQAVQAVKRTTLDYKIEFKFIK